MYIHLEMDIVFLVKFFPWKWMLVICDGKCCKKDVKHTCRKTLIFIEFSPAKRILISPTLEQRSFESIITSRRQICGQRETKDKWTQHGDIAHCLKNVGTMTPEKGTVIKIAKIKNFKSHIILYAGARNNPRGIEK
jgi:hypothetical protein